MAETKRQVIEGRGDLGLGVQELSEDGAPGQGVDLWRETIRSPHSKLDPELESRFQGLAQTGFSPFE